MAYAGNGYTTGDLDDIVADGLGTAGATIILFLSIIVILGVLIWGYRKIKSAK
jgi:hypothetical protein